MRTRACYRHSIVAFVLLGASTPALAQGPAPAAPAEPEAAPAPEAVAEPEAGTGEAGEEDPARPPSKGKGVLWGVITETGLNEPLPEAQVSVVGKKYKTTADIDGRYRLELPPGSYSIRIFYELHKPSRFDNVQVTLGQVTKLDVQLTAEEDAVVEQEVVTTVERSTVESQILRRQRSASVGDAIGRTEIAKTPDSNAAQAATRVVGTTIVDGRFVYVRGLGERYNNSLLNGTPLPSPEPDRAAVPLDLFPALVIDNLMTVKTFTPDIPGDFAGGSIQIETREIPSKPLFQITGNLGYNTQSTFRDRLSYTGSSTDFLGFDSGTRKLPDSFPDYVISRNKPNGERWTDQELAALGRDLNSFMTTQKGSSPPNHGVAILGGNGWDLGAERRLGMMAALTYGRSFVVRENEFRRTFRSGSQPIVQTLHGDVGIEKVNWGGLANVSYAFSSKHRLSLLGLRSQLSDNRAQEYENVDAANTTFRSTRTSFVSRALSFGQLRGEHEFSGLGRARLDWNASLSDAKRDEPDTRDTIYQLDSGSTAYVFSPTAENARHFFSDQGETQVGGGLDWTQPFAGDSINESKLKLGGLINRKNREFKARRFHFVRAGGSSNDFFTCPGTEFDEGCVDRLFLNDNIGPVIELVERTQPSDAYEASLDIYAGYLMVDASVVRDLRFIAGSRVEVTRQSIDPINQFATGEDAPPSKLNSTDPLPSIGIVYSPTTKTKLRASVTRTLARPQIRELSPFSFSDYFGGRSVQGNPDLRLTKITNADLRFEFFPVLREVLAFSFFYKIFKDPIEPVVVAASGDGVITFQNARGARLIGLELEARKSLGFMAPVLKDFSLITNVTFARSQINVYQTDIGFLTNTSRPMVNQAPYVANLALDFTNDDSGTGLRVLYNLVGPRLVRVGTNDLEDSYLQPRHTLDFTASQGLGQHFQLKFSAANILNSPFRETLGRSDDDERLEARYTDGTVYQIGASYTY